MISKNKSTDLYLYVLLAICIGILALMFSYGISGNDYWWHITAGKWILNNQAIPTHDIFSWVGQSQNLIWIAHEWLSEVVLYFSYAIYGQISTFIMCLVLGIVMIFLIYNVNKKYLKKNILFTIFFFLFLTILIKIFFFGRPHIFSFFLLFFEIKILYDFVNKSNYKGIYFIPLIGVLWANLHGGSSNLTYLLCIFFIVTGLFDFSFGKVVFEKLSRKKLKTLIIVTILSIFALCINPYGIEMIKYPFSNMADTLMLSIIEEWKSPDGKNFVHLVFFILPFALGIFSLVSTKLKIKANDLLLFIFFSFMFIRSYRFIVFLVITMGFFVFKYIPEFGTLNEVKTKTEKVFSLFLFIFPAALLVFACYNSTISYKNDKLISHYLDNDFVSLAKEEKPKSLYNDYGFGGDLIYYGVDVFVDGRADVYTGTPLSDYYNLTTMSLFEDSADNYNQDTFVADILNKYDFDAFLIRKERPLYCYLLSMPDKYQLIHDSDDTAYFKVR